MLEVSADSYEATKRTVTIVAGETQPVSLGLAPLQPPPIGPASAVAGPAATSDPVKPAAMAPAPQAAGAEPASEPTPSPPENARVSAAEAAGTPVETLHGARPKAAAAPHHTRP